MSKWMSAIQFESQSGKRVETEMGSLVPRTQVLKIRFPFGGLIWNRPISVEFEKNGQIEKIAIVDYTQLIIIFLFVIGILNSVIQIFLFLFNIRNNQIKEA